jgi:TonB family protein
MRAESPETRRPPEFSYLGVKWESRWANLRESADALLSGPWPSRTAIAPPLYLGTRWISNSRARAALAGSVLLHVVLVLLVVLSPHSRTAQTEIASAEEAPSYKLTWYPMKDLPRLSSRRGRESAEARSRDQETHRGADAFHPRQTILSMPRAPNHPRQTLIRPDAPPVAPKILPPLPNVVEWASLPHAEPARPRLNAERARRAPVVRQRNAEKITTPDIRAAQNSPSNIIFADNTPVVPRPRLPVGARPVTPAARTTDVAPPQITGTESHTAGSQNWIALSADPAPVPPPSTPPEGNLSARFSASPDGTHPGTPNGADNRGGGGKGEEGPGGSNRGTAIGDGAGPADISISGGGVSSPLSGNGLGPAGLSGGGDLHVMPGGSATPTDSAAANSKPARARPDAPPPPSAPLTEPADILRTKKFYTLYVNMPNLTSSTGSWVLDFAELNPDGTPALTSEGLSGPQPWRKVDPKYPPDLIHSNVQGEVILYAIIRRDGSVDSIQLVKGVDPELDRNAMEAFSRWKFRPALRHNEPVELESVVRIPFRANPQL